MVGYVLLVVFAIILSLIAYQWIKTYVPSESLQCPDSGVSVSIKALYYDCEGGNNNLYLNVKNSGRFSILGYFAHAANVSEQEVATIDLSQYFNETLSGGQRFGNSIAFISAEQNLFKPGDEKVAIFNLTDVGALTSIQIIPTRMQEVDNKNRFISCGNEIVKQDIYCGMDTRIVDTVCTPDCEGRVCDLDPVCGTLDCGIETGGCDSGTEFCDYAGQCISNTCTPDLNACDIVECGEVNNNSCGTGYCGNCNAGEICDVGGLCVPDGVCGPEADCSDSDCEGLPTSCPDGGTCQSGGCVSPGGTGASCINHCLSLGLGYTGSSCTATRGLCTGQGGGDYISEGNPECIASGSTFPNPKCCCTPAV